MKLETIETLKKKLGKKAINTFYSALRIIPDKPYLKLVYRIRLGEKLNLKNPVGINAKLNYLKLYKKNPEYSRMVDKEKAKEYVSEKIGSQYIIPTLAIYKSVDEIDYSALPEQFVLKCTHDSGTIAICTDKKTFDYAAAEKKLREGLKRDFFAGGREYPYKGLERKIIAEQYMGVIEDFKFYCFNGKVKFAGIISDRFTDMKMDFVDTAYRRLHFSWGEKPSPVLPEKPSLFEQMIEIAEKLSEGIPFVRVDLYQIGNRIYFGELTFFQDSGFYPLTPREWDENLGRLIKL